MDKVILFLIPMLILQCFLHWCSTDEHTYKLESFKRWNNTNRFLKAKWVDSKKAYELSFTGRREEDNTSFIFRYETLMEKTPLRIHLANDSSYFLAVNDTGRGLVVKKYTTADPITKGSYNFDQKRVSIPFTNGNDSCYLTVIQSLERTGKAIKCSNSGSVSLSKMENCACDCWIRIKSPGYYQMHSSLKFNDWCRF